MTASETESLFDYNLNTLTLDEARKCSDWDVQHHCGRALASGDKGILATLFCRLLSLCNAVSHAAKVLDMCAARGMAQVGIESMARFGPAVVAHAFAPNAGKWLLFYVLGPVVGAVLAAVSYLYMFILPGKRGVEGLEPVG